MKTKICSVGECMIEIANTKNNIFQQSFAGDTLNFCNYIDKKYFDDLIPVGSEDGVDMARQLAAKEGIITGISGGSTFKVALDLAKNAEPGSNILCMLPDTAERYMSSPLFETIEEDMNSEENIIAKSTPGFHMDSVER